VIEVPLNKLIADEKEFLQYLQGLRDNNQMVSFTWEDKSYPFADELISEAKKEYERGSIPEICPSVNRVKRNCECPWEIHNCSEAEFKVSLGMRGYRGQWTIEACRELFLLFIVESIAIVIIGAVFGGLTFLEPTEKYSFWGMTFSAFKFLEPYLIVYILLQVLHPAFSGDLALVYSIILTSLFTHILDVYNFSTALVVTIPLLAIIYTVHTEMKKKKLDRYRKYIPYYYKKQQ